MQKEDSGDTSRDTDVKTAQRIDELSDQSMQSEISTHPDQPDQSDPAINDTQIIRHVDTSNCPITRNSIDRRETKFEHTRRPFVCTTGCRKTDSDTCSRCGSALEGMSPNPYKSKRLTQYQFCHKCGDKFGKLSTVKT